MDPERWSAVRAAFDQLVELDLGARAERLAALSAGDPDLRRAVEALLEADAEAEERLAGLMFGLPAPAPESWIGRTVSHYEILDRIGGGGMGVVYRARDVRLDRTVALKVIAPEIGPDSEARRRFLNEARAASALDHPNVCTVHEIAETDEGRLYIVMAAYDGETLRARLGRGPMAEQEAVEIGEQVARALAAAHERGIVHRDVKPDNVFVTREGVVKLLDFGLARTADSRMSGPGAVEGTVAYMSPEQARVSEATSGVTCGRLA